MFQLDVQHLSHQAGLLKDLIRTDVQGYLLFALCVESSRADSCQESGCCSVRAGPWLTFLEYQILQCFVLCEVLRNQKAY